MSAEDELADGVLWIAHSELEVLDRRFRAVRRLASLVAVASVLFAIAATLVHHGTAVQVLASMAVCGLLATWVGVILAVHSFLLLPVRYLRWLRSIEPYEPETYWGQALHRLVSWSGACLVLVLGGIIGAELGAQKTTGQLTEAAWQWAGFLLVGGFLYFWWTRFLVELAAIHRRALKRGQLVTHPATGESVWLLFVTVWVLGFVATGLAAAIAPFVWQEILRFVGISTTAS